MPRGIANHNRLPIAILIKSMRRNCNYITTYMVRTDGRHLEHEANTVLYLLYGPCSPNLEECYPIAGGQLLGIACMTHCSHWRQRCYTSKWCRCCRKHRESPCRRMNWRGCMVGRLRGRRRFYSGGSEPSRYNKKQRKLLALSTPTRCALRPQGHRA